ncbi:hypothetical protein SPRG_08973 [Saprolegnia parasitica CBS 223.65]|uniref:Uncharacterized protein n=1 Tax=Saprolegnia parasitica (strain CBS 223.65) TaxID=695850 RepID=A0A067C4K7_SAPPC|nr:hypothetical protein SPRG_08973 [Saprolegnia parasitica CBS 223.65]KDO25674.1 hypothetical protein SPRG_08973 [Saprolegnia parasitica CBS 223.65]|eukprot:XP_012203704.1 hypothetical protein SPRG_08973 [Saprolegnia parasitica CBS 223.65]
MDTTLMEEELMAQRDVAKLIVQELRSEVEAYKARVRTMERRLELSETKRIQVTAVARRAKAKIAAHEQSTYHEILLLLLGGILGGFFGWCLGLVVLVLDGPPALAFLLMGPSVACLVAHRKRHEWRQETHAMAQSTKHLRPTAHRVVHRDAPLWRSTLQTALHLTHSIVSFLYHGHA